MSHKFCQCRVVFLRSTHDDIEICLYTERDAHKRSDVVLLEVGIFGQSLHAACDIKSPKGTLELV